MSQKRFHTEIYAHRGGAGLAPENSLLAFEKALSLGVEVLDMDVGITRDHQVVAYHDLYLEPSYTCYQDGRLLGKKRLWLQDLTFEELQAFDIGRLTHSLEGVSIPTLKSVIQLAKKKAGSAIRFQIEIKTDPRYPQATVPPEELTKAVVDVVKTEGVQQQTEIHSFDWRNLMALQKLDSQIVPSFITSFRENREHFLTGFWCYQQWFAGYHRWRLGGSWAKMIHRLGGKIWCPDYRDLTEKQIAEAHEEGLRVVPWTANQEADMLRLLQFQVDGIITNYPDRLKSLLSGES